MKKKQIFFVTLVMMLIVFGGLLAPSWRGVTGAKDINDIIDKQISDPGGLVETGLPGDADDTTQLVVDLIRGFLGFLGLIFMVLILYAGFKWMTSGGNSSTIDEAKGMILNAVIGLIVIGFSFAITQFVFSVILKT